MKKGLTQFCNGTLSNRRAATLRELFLISITIVVLFLPSVLELPQHYLSYSGRTDLPSSIHTNSCSTPSNNIATFIISCGNGETDAVAEMRPLITSMILLSSIPLQFIFITDDDGVHRIQQMFGSLVRTRRRIIVQTVKLSEEWMHNWAAQTNIDMYAHHSGMFGMSKFAIPWLLPNISLGVVMDTDMVMLKDPALLWQEALREEGEGFKPGWIYRMMLSKKMEKPSQICSCVMAMRLQKAREGKVYPELITKVLEEFPRWKRGGIYKPLHGDQGLFYGLWNVDNRLVGHLDAVWNRDHCHNFNGIFKEGNDKNAGILHRNCYQESSPTKNQTNDGSPPFFNFYEAYPWRWLSSPDAHGCDVEIANME